MRFRVQASWWVFWLVLVGLFGGFGVCWWDFSWWVFWLVLVGFLVGFGVF